MKLGQAYGTINIHYKPFDKWEALNMTVAFYFCDAMLAMSDALSIGKSYVKTFP